MRVNEMIAGIRSDVGVKVFGDDFKTLKAKGREIEQVMRDTRGAADVFAEQVTGQPVLQIEIDRQAIARQGINARDVLDVVEALGTREVGEMQEGERRFPITVRLDEQYRGDVSAVGRILVSTLNGERIPLERLARISVLEGPSTINREWAKRRVVVQANVRGRDVGSYVAEVRRGIDQKVSLPPGYYVRFGGQFEHLERAQGRLMIVIPLALGLIFGLLYLTFHSIHDAARVFVAVPLAVVGGVVALLFRGLPFSISAAVGFIALSGVSVLNALVLVSTMRQMLGSGMPIAEAIPAAAERRLRPVLMTALVASLGFVPMALNTGIGSEVQRPLATVVIGGIVSSTVLTLFVLPVIYLLAEKRSRRQVEEPEALRAVGS
jgi:cobalt-zinc-cadmium resistance protein CzcA